MWRVNSKVYGTKCKVQSVKFKVWSLKYKVWRKVFRRFFLPLGTITNNDLTWDDNKTFSKKANARMCLLKGNIQLQTTLLRPQINLCPTYLKHLRAFLCALACKLDRWRQRQHWNSAKECTENYTERKIQQL